MFSSGQNLYGKVKYTDMYTIKEHAAVGIGRTSPDVVRPLRGTWLVNLTPEFLPVLFRLLNFQNFVEMG